MEAPDEPQVRADVEAQRTWLDEGAWVDVARGWMAGDEALLEVLRADLPWSPGRIYRYDHWVEEPRLGATYRLDRAPHPSLVDAHRMLQHRYRVRFPAPGCAQYRDGRDSVAFHRDRELRWLDDTIIAILVLGARRPFLLRPRANRYAHEMEDRGAAHDLRAGAGDLLVMGGGCQARWEHAVPKVPGRVGPRVSVQWRWTAKTGRPEQGANYRAPRLYSR